MMSRLRRTTHRTLKPVMTALLAAALVLGSAPAQLEGQEPTFTFISRGFGHGIGMSQWGAKGFAEKGYGYAHILRHYYGSGGTDPKTALTTLSSEPIRDVNVDREANYDSGANAGYTRSSWNLRPGHAGSQLAVMSGSTVDTYPDGWTTISASGNNVVVRNAVSGATKTYAGTIAVWGATGSPRLTQVREGTGFYNYEYVRFRGEMRVSASSGMLKLINRVSMTEYLYGVVPRESPASWHIEALKAQAVAARGYAITATRAELYTTTRDQVYGGHSRGSDRSNTEAHEYASTNSAVDATARQVVTYGGVAVRTFFASTSGGYTEHNENIWSGGAQSHLRGVPDPFELASGSKYHSWSTVTYTASQARTQLLAAGVAASALPAAIADIRVTARGVSGRPTAITITGTDGKAYPFAQSSMDRFRNAFGLGRSRWIHINPKSGRIQGADRYETSVNASKRVFTSPQTVIVAGGRAPADALAASGLAGAVGGAPVLLTPASRLDSRVAEEIRRLSPGKVYLVGGTAVLSSQVEADLRALPGLGAAGAVQRLAGSDRYGTARVIALEIKARGVSTPRAIVVSGESLADAVAAAGLAYSRKLPIIPVKAATVPGSSAEALQALGVTESLVVGGEAVVGAGVFGELPGAKRIAAGKDRYETAGQLADYITANEGFNWGSVYVSSGHSLVDALSAGPVTGHNRNPMLFVRPWGEASATTDRLVARKSSLWRVHIVGGEAAVPGWNQSRIETVFD